MLSQKFDHPVVAFNVILQFQNCFATPPLPRGDFCLTFGGFAKFPSGEGWRRRILLKLQNYVECDDGVV